MYYVVLEMNLVIISFFNVSMQLIFGQEYSNAACNIEGLMNGILKLNGSVVIGRKNAL